MFLKLLKSLKNLLGIGQSSRDVTKFPEDLPRVETGKNSGDVEFLEDPSFVEGHPYITRELHEEMLAKKKRVDERRREFQATLSQRELRRRGRELEDRVKHNRPLQFKWVRPDEGEPVGFPLFIFHITLHDMFPLACRQFLTEEVLLAGLNCNAVSRGRFVRINELEAFIEVQPRRISILEKLLDV